MDPTVSGDEEVERVIRSAVNGGVTLVQIREKNCSSEEFLRLAYRASKILRHLGIPLIVNDRVDVALQVGAQGVHIGPSDLPWCEARRLLGPEAIIGVSVENLAQAKILEKANIDYFGVSSVFPTRTKPDVARIWGLEGLKTLRAETRIPLVGIGGIDESNIKEVMRAGADGAAIVSAICSSPNPFLNAHRLRSLIDEVNSERKKEGN